MGPLMSRTRLILWPSPALAGQEHTLCPTCRGKKSKATWQTVRSRAGKCWRPRATLHSIILISPLAFRTDSKSSLRLKATPPSRPGPGPSSASSPPVRVLSLPLSAGLTFSSPASLPCPRSRGQGPPRPGSLPGHRSTPRPPTLYLRPSPAVCPPTPPWEQTRAGSSPRAAASSLGAAGMRKLGPDDFVRALTSSPSHCQTEK